MAVWHAAVNALRLSVMEFGSAHRSVSKRTHLVVAFGRSHEPPTVRPQVLFYNIDVRPRFPHGFGARVPR